MTRAKRKKRKAHKKLHRAAARRMPERAGARSGRKFWGGSRRAGAAAKRPGYYLLGEVPHVKLDQYAKDLHALRKTPDRLVMLSENQKGKRNYYLASLGQVRKELNTATRKRPGTKSHDRRVRERLKKVGFKLPELKDLRYVVRPNGGKVPAVDFTFAPGPRVPALVHVKAEKPVVLVSNNQTLQKRLAPELKKLMRNEMAELTVGEGTFLKAPTLGLPGAPAGAWAGGLAGGGAGSGVGRGSVGGHAGGGSRPEANRSAAARPRKPIRVRTALPLEPPKKSRPLPGPPTEWPVYPDIEIANRHPVQGTTIDIFVSLKFQPSEATQGKVEAPKDLEEHVFDLHLLLGKTSEWGTLKFQRPGGTKEKAEFKGVKVPVLDGSETKIEGHSVADIWVNFYLEGRWCGEATQRIEVLASAGGAQLAALETPEAPPWRTDLLVTPGTPPPDLLVRIKRTGAQDFEWSLVSPHMNFPRDPERMRMSLTDAPYRYVKEHFEIFMGSSTLTDEVVEALHANCSLIFEAAPRGFREGYRTLRATLEKDKFVRELRTIQFVSDEPFVPWELMRVSDPADEPAFQPEILCVEHNVGRWLASDSTQLRNWLEVKEIAVAASDYTKENVAKLPALPWAEEERKMLLAAPYDATDVTLQLPALLNFLKTSGAEILHFSCHGNTDALTPDQATLRTTDDAVGLRAPRVSVPEVRSGAGKRHPLVFLNACQSAGAGTVIGLVFGWPQAFLQMGATACVAPLWRVVDERAKDIAKYFYEATLGDRPISIGEALRNIRSQWKANKSLTHLGYVLYGDPETKLGRKAGAATRAKAEVELKDGG